jgi:hypothetical protein
MPELTRRRTWDDQTEDWSIYYGDIGVGRIMQRQGAPHRDEQWRWSVGFYPGAHPNQNVNGYAVSFEDAREKWQAAWERYLPDRTEAEFEEYRAWRRRRGGKS